jgi:hypothetical protein
MCRQNSVHNIDFRRSKKVFNSTPIIRREKEGSKAPWNLINISCTRIKSNVQHSASTSWHNTTIEEPQETERTSSASQRVSRQQNATFHSTQKQPSCKQGMAEHATKTNCQ